MTGRPPKPVMERLMAEGLQLDHLEPVTAQENTRRARALITECPHGHPYDEQNTSHVNGQRVCRACNRARALANYHRKQAAKREGISA